MSALFESAALFTTLKSLGETLKKKFSLHGRFRGDHLGGSISTLEKGTAFAQRLENDPRPFALNVWSGENRETGCVELRIFDRSPWEPGTRPYTPEDGFVA